MAVADSTRITIPSIFSVPAFSVLRAMYRPSANRIVGRLSRLARSLSEPLVGGTLTDRPASIEDVAQRAGVSTATVSRVLNSPEKVAAATAERVRDAMAHLDYRPNQFASGLMTRRSGVIGLVLPDGFEGVSIEMIRRADDEAWRLGFHLLLIAESRLREAAEVRGSAALGMLDAVAILSARPPGAVVENAAGLGVPVAAVEPVPTSGASTNPAEPAETAAALVRAAVRLALERR